MSRARPFSRVPLRERAHRTGKPMSAVRYPVEQAAAEAAVIRVLERRYPGCSAFVVREHERHDAAELRRSGQTDARVAAPHDMNPPSNVPAAAA